MRSAILKRASPDVEGELTGQEQAPWGFPITTGPERTEEFSPGLSPELMELANAARRMMGKSILSSIDNEELSKGSH